MPPIFTDTKACAANACCEKQGDQPPTIEQQIVKNLIKLREDAHELLDCTDNLSQYHECLTKPETLRYVQEMSELTANMLERLRAIQAIIHQDASTCRMDRPSKDNGSIDPGIAPRSSSAGSRPGRGPPVP